MNEMYLIIGVLLHITLIVGLVRGFEYWLNRK